MDLVIALEMSRLQLIDDARHKNLQQLHHDGRQHDDDDDDGDGDDDGDCQLADEVQLRLAIHMSLEDAAKMIPAMVKNHVANNHAVVVGAQGPHRQPLVVSSFDKDDKRLFGKKAILWLCTFTR